MQTSATRLRELTIKYSVKRDRDGQSLPIGPVVASPREAGELLQRILQDEAVEVFGMLCLTTKHRVIAYHEVSRGQLDGTPVHPREVFKVALLANAAAIVVAHNHPSGDPTPSGDDQLITRRLVEAGQLLGIPVLDHIIIGDGGPLSMRRTDRSGTAFPNILTL